MSAMTDETLTLDEWHEAFANAHTTVLMLRMHDPLGALDKAVEYRDHLLDARLSIGQGVVA